MKFEKCVTSFLKASKYLLSFFYGLLLLSGCVPYDSLVNYSASEIVTNQPQEITNYQPIKIEPNDILQISISTQESEMTSLLNASSGFLVGNDGSIDYPLIGNVALKDLTIPEAQKHLQSALQKYFVNKPTVNIRLTNFKINVNGEVSNPGSFVVSNERISLIDAITLAGDFTDYSSREDILIVRETDGKRIYAYVNFLDVSIMNSPYYYLKQNDVIYVKPERRIKGTVRGSSDRLLPYAQFSLSLTLVLTAIFNLR